jgi:signal transduction histidine kinase
MISPWTAIIVHIIVAIKSLLILAGFVSVMTALIGVGLYIENIGEATEAAMQRADAGKKIITGSCIAIALAITAYVLIPPSTALARILVVQQLPEDADIEVVDELVYRVCKEVTGR